MLLDSKKLQKHLGLRFELPLWGTNLLERPSVSYLSAGAV